MRGIESAEVHIALHETSSFRQPDRRPEASVVLRLRNGMEPSAEVVRGIAQLVASSVDGLKSDDVMVLDDSGRLLSIPNETGSGAAAASRQLAAQREMEAYLRTKAEQIVAQIVGPGNARVDISALLNFDRVDRTTQAVDPNRQALTAEQKAEIIPGAQGGAGSTNRSASYENSRSLESFTGAIGTVRRLSVAVLVNERAAAKDSKTPTEPRTQEELDRIRVLVAAAVGADTSRGDVISVASMPFAPPTIMRDSPSVWTVVRESERPILVVLGLLLAFFVALRAIRSLRPTPVPELAAADTALALQPEQMEGNEPLGLESPEAEPIVLLEPRPNPVREGITAAVTERPELAARLVRAWLKEA
jgi:flagellar M-ring protein FliF